MKVVNLKKESYTHYIGRGSIFGNPFKITGDCTREMAIDAYRVHALCKPELMEAIKELPSDAVLGCYCKPQACHGDVIIELYEEMKTGKVVNDGRED